MVEHVTIVSASKVTEVLKYEELIDTIETSFKSFSSRPESGVCQPLRSVIHVPEETGFLGVMPAYSPKDNALATKLVTFFPKNKDVPTHNAVIILFDVVNGIPKTLMDGEVITAMRTASASAVATKYLSKEDSKTLAILGAGTQAKSHYYALSHVRSFQDVRVWNRNSGRAETLASEIGATVCSTVEEAVKDADVIVTATSSPTPVLKKEWVKPGAHINGVGACVPTWHELEPDLVRSCVVYADSYEGGSKESGDIVLAKAEIYAELGEVVLKRKEARKQETTFFKSLGRKCILVPQGRLIFNRFETSTGLGIQDAVSAKLVMDKIGEEKK